MVTYKYKTIQINSRPVHLSDILHHQVSAETSFEEDTFKFICEWFSDASHFKFQTSGSTGQPKQITFTREQITLSAQSTIKALHLSSSETSLLCLPTKYIAGKMMLIRSFVNHMKLIVCEPTSNPLEKIDPLVNIDFVALVPLQIETMLINNMASRLNSINNIIVGGAPISIIARQKILDKLTTNVFATYGMTETLSHIALENISIGNDLYVPLPGVEIELDTRGCLVVKTPLSPDSIITNDLAEIISEKAFHWLGRWDNVINTGGIKVIPEVLEKKISEIFTRLNINRRFFITGIFNEKLGQHVALIIEGDPTKKELQETLKREIINNFLKIEIPREFVFIEQFCETETGKINRTETKKLIVNTF